MATNIPASRDIADREMPWGLDWDHLHALPAFLQEKIIAGELLVDLTGCGPYSPVTSI